MYSHQEVGKSMQSRNDILITKRFVVCIYKVKVFILYGELEIYSNTYCVKRGPNRCGMTGLTKATNCFKVEFDCLWPIEGVEVPELAEAINTEHIGTSFSTKNEYGISVEGFFFQEDADKIASKPIISYKEECDQY